MAKKPIHQNNHVIATHQTVTHYQGNIPHPDVLKGLDDILPGTAERLIKLAEAEVKHRQNLDILTANANIEAQSKQLAIEVQQTKAVFRSDLIGQIAGFIVCLACIAAAAYLGLNNHDWLAGVISAIPTAALIKAFILKK